MILSDIPDYYDEVQGELFSDKSGEQLRKIVKALKLEFNSL